jgi:hypothetical protein
VVIFATVIQDENPEVFSATIDTHYNMAIRQDTLSIIAKAFTV